MTTEHPMQLGMIGLGRMGSNIVRRLFRHGHECVVYDIDQAAVEDLVSEGATGAETPESFVASLEHQRTIWIMVPAGVVGRTIDGIASLLDGGDITVIAGTEEGVPAPVIGAALNERFESRDLGTFTGKVLSAMRSEFGGYAEKDVAP